MFVPGSLYRTVMNEAGSPVNVNVTVNGGDPVRWMCGWLTVFELPAEAMYVCMFWLFVQRVAWVGSMYADGGSLNVTLNVVLETVPLQKYASHTLYMCVCMYVCMRF